MAVTAMKKEDDWCNYPIVPHEAPPPDNEFDPIYLTKSSVRLGVTITYYGRTARCEKWIVENIWTFRSEKYGRVRSWMPVVRTNYDIVELRNDKTLELKPITFNYLSNSVRWRIDEADAPRLAPNGRPAHE